MQGGDHRGQVFVATDQWGRRCRQVDGGSGGDLWSGGGRRAGECRVLAQHLLVQLLQRRGRVDPQLVGEHRAVVRVAGQGVGLPAGAVEREDQAAAQAFAERMGVHELLEARDGVVPAAGPQREVDPQLLRIEPQLRQPGRLGTGELLVGELRERRPAPQSQRLVERLERVQPAAGPASLGDQALEAVGVGAAGGEHVAGRPREQRRLRAEHATQPRHQDLHRVRGVGGLVVAPHGRGEAVDRHDLARVHQQHREQPAQAGRERWPPDRLHRPQHADVHDGNLSTSHRDLTAP